MQVLLIGEASGVHRNLKKGLQTLGVDALHVMQSAAPSWKWYDKAWAPDWPGLRGGFARNVVPFFEIARLKRVDVANFVNTITAVHGLHTRYLDIPAIRRKTRVMSYYALGCDEIGLIRENPQLPYSPCKTCLASGEVLGRDCAQFLFPRIERSRELVRRYFDFGASSMLEYGHTESLFPRGFSRIAFPVDVDMIPFEPATTRTKSRIVHTPTRRGFKGTDVVIDAIHKLREVRRDFEFQIVEGLAYADYLEAVRHADIVIDQVHSQSSGMNGLEMMAAGKVILTGSTPLGRAYFPFGDESPAFDASPDPRILADTLSSVLDRKAEFPHIAQASRAYVERNHDVVKVAQQFLDGWTAAMDLKDRSHSVAAG